MRYNHYIWSLALALGLGACSQYEEMPSGGNYASTAMTQEEKDVSNILRSSQHGWSLVLIPDEGNHGGINLSMKFTSDKDVVVASEEYGETVTVPNDPKNPGAGTKQIYQTEFTSNYHFSHNSGLRLTFDTFSRPLHYYSNPNWGLPNGYNGDFEFIVEKVSEDKNVIYLKGCRTGNKMQLTRLKANHATYLSKTQEIKEALKGKALSPLQLGGKEVSISIFGYARQLWVRYTKAEDKTTKSVKENIPFYYTDKGIKLITPLEIGGQKFEGFELSEDKRTVKTLDGKQTLTVFSGTYDLTEGSLRASFEEDKSNSEAHEMFKTLVEIQKQDSYPASFWFMADMGRWGRSRLPQVTLYAYPEPNPNNKTFYRTYYLDYTSVYGQPNQVHITRIIQDGDGYFYSRRAIEWYLENILYYSPFSIDPIPNKTVKKMSSVADPTNEPFYFEVDI
ncbi:DUF4302 domain-containing protein [Porphyromonas catoniae]|uniref:DUF4302 domain-containing protein n=1 Tax=Porphyromonas catoniae TaxID=41976 RepID=UPI0023F1C259|nr:DUF4302 domain-containing protein [Porphyromonas catoniae]